jgi:hypothetical protein
MGLRYLFKTEPAPLEYHPEPGKDFPRERTVGWPMYGINTLFAFPQLKGYIGIEISPDNTDHAS